MNNPYKYSIHPPKTKSEFSEYYKLRWEILRKPLGQSIKECQDELENISHHVIAININHKVIGAGRIHYINSNVAQIRYMAVDIKYRGNNAGSRILKYLIDKALSDNISKIFLHARENSIDFYIKNDFKIIKKSHLLLNKIQHYLMEKDIA